MTPGQRWRFRRDVVIALAYRHGISQSVLADVFDLPRSRITAILRRVSEQSQAVREKVNTGESEDCKPSRIAFHLWLRRK